MAVNMQGHLPGLAITFAAWFKAMRGQQAKPAMSREARVMEFSVENSGRKLKVWGRISIDNRNKDIVFAGRDLP